MTVWDAIAADRAALAAPSFAADAGSPSIVTQQFRDEAAQRAQDFDAGIAYATRSRPHDQRDLEEKLAVGQGTNGAGGSTGTGGTSSGGSSSGGSGSSGGSSSGPPSWFKHWAQNQRSRNRGGGRGLSGGGLVGPKALGNFNLPNVPAGAAQPTTGPSPLLIVALLAIAGVGGYFLWHKLRVSRAIDKKLDKGGEPSTDAT